LFISRASRLFTVTRTFADPLEEEEEEDETAAMAAKNGR
jgi:hypothetical protein